MTVLESMIKRLTRETPNGGCCQIGDASITVRYCSDIWEWEYQCETFWDVQDLAEALIRSNGIAPHQALALPNRAKASREGLVGEAAREGFFMGTHDGSWGGVS
jgi:hypothetical protein